MAAALRHAYTWIWFKEIPEQTSSSSSTENINLTLCRVYHSELQHLQAPQEPVLGHMNYP